jgi:hypothetical protein
MLVLTQAIHLKLIKSLLMQTAGNCIEKSIPITTNPHFSDLIISYLKMLQSFKTESKGAVE